MEPMRRLKLTSDGVGGTVLLDGQDISNGVRQVTITAHGKEVTTATVELMVTADIEVNGRVELILGDGAARALVALGWTAPVADVA